MDLLEANKQVVRQYVEAFNQGDSERLRTLFTPDAIIYGVMGWGEIDKVIPIWRQLHDGLAIELHVEEIVAEGERVAVRYVERGRSVGTFFGNAPTGKSYELTAMEWFVMKDGKIWKRWGARDSAAQSRQLGFPPS
jgi:predicted ester cyclase